jgi:6-phosphogluconolactonase
MGRAIVVVEDPAAEAAERIAAAVRRGGQIALAGGSTPAAAYAQLRAMNLAWGRTELWLGDERCVPPDDPRSNHLMVTKALLSGIPGADAPRAWHRIRGELGPDAAAEALEAELRESFGAVDPFPVFDLILLGIGPDAHTASLFPHKPALRERERWAVGVPEAGHEPLVPRVTLTLPVLDAAREVMFLIAGEGKAEAVGRAFGDRSPGPDAPAGMVGPRGGTLTVLLDPPAARLLDGSG